MNRRDLLRTPSFKNYAWSVPTDSTTTAFTLVALGALVTALAGLPRLIISPAAILAALMANLA